MPSSSNQLLGRDGGSLADCIPFAALASQMPRRRRGRKTSVATIYRWSNQGCRGVKLRFIQVGATRCSTLEWVGQFFDELTEAQTSQPGHAAQLGASRTSNSVPAVATTVRTSAARQRAHQAAERELAKLGM